MSEESLLSGVQAEQEEKTIEQGEAEERQTEAEEQKSARPDSVDEAFWDPETNSIKQDELLDAYNQEKEKALGLRRKLSEKGGKPPKDVGEYSYNEDLFELLPADSPTTKILKDTALDAGLSKEQFGKFINAVMPALDAEGVIFKPEAEKTPEEKQQEFEEYRDAELAKLGKDGPGILQRLANWGNGMVNKGVISKDEKPVFEAMITDAPSIALLTKIMSLTGESTIPVKTAVADGLPSRAEIDQLIASPEYENGNADVHRKVKEYFEKTA
jgi:hypothetical protein